MSNGRETRRRCTRHTYAILALEAGKSVRWVADQLGHGDPEITLRTYTHALPAQEQDLSFADFGELGCPPAAQRRMIKPRARARAKGTGS